MPLFFSKKPETETTLYSYEVVEDTSASPSSSDAQPDPDASTTSGRHCAWCGDPPDRHGSHGICARHQQEMLAAAAIRSRKRGRA